MTLREIRTNNNITLKEASIITNVPLRTYIRYEENEEYGNIYKRDAMKNLLINNFVISEEKGILKVEDIKKKVSDVLAKYGKKVKNCYLFGSYAKGYASEKSDVDLLVSTTLTGLDFVGLSEELHEALNKNIDLIRLNDLENNFALLSEVMSDGVKIYG